ncbi:MAG: phosphoribosyl-ATP diphosphatase [Ardenticatenia bacterium]|nr:phosphoribosyl-ATP diphosphatase [Ardenticatenia bacterium]
MSASIMRQLEDVILRRHQERPPGSYTASLFEAGQDNILKKVAEEAGETIIASKNASRAEVIYEVGDLVYHLLVLLRWHGISWAEIEAELARRYRSTSDQEGGGDHDLTGPD